jgi:hypothetical protein
MFGGKINKHSITQAFGKLKHHVGEGYRRTKHFLGQVDQGINLAKRAYGVVAPILDQHGGGQANKHIMKAFGGYESLRNKVMDAHDTVGNHVVQVVGNLKKKVPELGL